MNSGMGQLFSEKYSTGGINPFLGLGNIRRLPFPVMERKQQWRIGESESDYRLCSRLFTKSCRAHFGSTRNI